jgi:iron complex outermembrane receptor protein
MKVCIPKPGMRQLAIAVAVQAACFAPMTVQAQDGSKYNLALEEVIVTAQKREEDFMSVPVTVNAFTAQDMVNTGAATIQDIDSFMPGVEIDDTAGGTTQVGITVRGVSSPNISSGQDPSVATFYDGSYMPRAVTSIPFTDIARTEVLKGPQGTLFGRNATAGVINIVPNKPGQEFEGFVKARIGSEDLQRFEGMINVPISDSLALRGNIFSHKRDGFTKNATGGSNIRDEDFLAVRGVALWTLGDSTDIQLAADYEDRDEMPRPAIGVNPDYSYQGSVDPFRSADQHDVLGSSGEYTGRNNEEETREMYGISLQVNHDFNDAWSMFGIASYREWDTTNLQEEDGTAEPRRYVHSNNIEESDIFYSEVRFNYVDDRINLIFGANYSKEDVYQRTDIGFLADSYMQFVSQELLPILGYPSDPNVHAWDEDVLGNEDLAFWLGASDFAGLAVLPPGFAGETFGEIMDNTGDFVNWGVFVDTSYQLTDTVRVSAGLRYSYDEKEYSWQTFESDLNWPVDPIRVNYDPAQTGAPESEWYNKFVSKDDWNKTTGRLVFDWQFTDYAMTYFSFATGYKSGGFDGQSFLSVTSGSFDPEEMTSYEWGLKGDFLEDTVRLELALFYHELDGRQRSEQAKDGPDDPVATPRVLSSDLEAEGVEVIVTWNVTDTLRLSGLTTWRETDEVSEQYYNSAGELAGGDTDTTESETDYTLKLDWTPKIPRGYLLVHVNYVFDEDPGPKDDDPIFTTGKWYYQDKKLLNARIAWSNESDNFEVALWGLNLLDDETASNPEGEAASELGAYHTRPDDTLTWGVDLQYRF